jgi:hypothetical protein
VRNTPITTVDFRSFDDTPVPPGIQVTVLSDNGETTTTTMMWTGNVTLGLEVPGTFDPFYTPGEALVSDGVASFGSPDTAPRIGRAATGYRFNAASTDATGTHTVTIFTEESSNAFTIVLAAGPCLEGVPCIESASSEDVDGNTRATVSTLAGDGDTVYLSISAATNSFDVQGLLQGCGPDFVQHSDVVQFAVLGTGGGEKLLELTLLGATLPANKYDVCWAGLSGDDEEAWTTGDGTPAVAVENVFRDLDDEDITLYVGILGKCKNTSPRALGPPCWVSKKKSGTSVIVTVRAPAGDPRGFI